MEQVQHESKARLSDLSELQLRQVIYARLQGDPSIGPPFDPRVGPDPLAWLSDQYRRGDAGLQHRMTAVLRDCLAELPDTQRWPEQTRCALLDLIQDCGESLIDDLLRLIRQRALLDAEGLGPDAHAGLLKCLISNGHRVTPEFWFEQLALLGPRYGALIFSGLIDHGLDIAMRQLPALSADPEARQQIRWLFPHLKDRYGVQAVREALDARQGHLAEETYRLYCQDLIVPDLPDATIAASVDKCGNDPASARDDSPTSISSQASPAPTRVPSDLGMVVKRAKHRSRANPLNYSGLFAA